MQVTSTAELSPLDHNNRLIIVIRFTYLLTDPLVFPSSSFKASIVVCAQRCSLRSFTLKYSKPLRGSCGIPLANMWSWSTLYSRLLRRTILWFSVRRWHRRWEEEAGVGVFTIFWLGRASLYRGTGALHDAGHPLNNATRSAAEPHVHHN